MRKQAIVGLFVIITAVAANTALAQVSVPAGTSGVPAGPSDPPYVLKDARWTPWLGCWRLSQDNSRSSNSTVDAILGRSSSASVAPGMSVCVTPSAAGVTMTTYADGKVLLTQNIAADGARHPVSDAGCQGTQSSEWSRDGRRLFTNVDVACNNRPAQKASGITLFTKGPVWLDIQSVDADGEQQVRIRRYERLAEWPEGLAALPHDLLTRAAMDAQGLALQRMSTEDVIEASKHIASPALEAALLETGSKTIMSASTLTQLADAGVSPSVIDLMVAQAYPERFRVDRPQPVYPNGPIVSTGNLPPSMLPGYPPYATAPYNPYDPFFYSYYYYSPFAYPFYISTPRYYIINGNTIVGDGSSLDSSNGNGLPTTGGQVVNGRGYTHVRPAGSSDNAQAAPTQRSGSSGQRVRSVVNSGSGGAEASSGSGSSSSSGASSSSGSSSSGSSSGSSGSAVSNSGYSNGGGSDSGRTAQPR